VNGINGSDRFFKNSSWVNENTLTYNNTFNTYHRVNAVIGFTDQKSMSSQGGAAANQLPEQANSIAWLSSGTPSQVYSGSSSSTLASFLGRINYTYHSKYLLTVSFRADGSSKFAPQNHWSYFPSGALAWRFGDENIFKGSNILSNGKLRVSYGITGNNRVGDFDYLSQFNTSPILQGYPFEGIPTPGTIPSVLGNPNLKWETTAQTDLGLDLGFLKNRIDLTVDVYRKKTTNLLLNAHIPTSYGFTSIFKNIGSVRNEGLEITLNTINISQKNFSWSSNFNIAFNSNEVLALAENQHAITNLYAPFDNTISTVPAFVAIVGRPMGLMYGPVWDGVYQYDDFDKTSSGGYVLKETVPTNGNPGSTIQPGDIKYKDLNGDGVVDNNDFTVIGRGLPIFTGGFGNNFTYKGFDLNVFFQWSYGNDVLNANRLVFEGDFNARPGLNQFADYKNRWTPDNPNSDLFRAKGQGPRANMFSSRVIEDGSYLRLKTVSLGYNLPKELIRKLSMQSLRVYVSAQNLYTWTNYSGMDPEVSIYNNVLTPDVDFSAYPRARIVTFGLNISF
jgi:TonB-linked SusC/RagA family outer membrane protein